VLVWYSWSKSDSEGLRETGRKQTAMPARLHQYGIGDPQAAYRNIYMHVDSWRVKASGDAEDALGRLRPSVARWRLLVTRRA
jgi:hypothetical protein